MLKAVDNDIEHTVFSFIPNTAEVAFFGMMEGFEEYLNRLKTDYILSHQNNVTREDLERILSMRVRPEKVVIKDIKLRTSSPKATHATTSPHTYTILLTAA